MRENMLKIGTPVFLVVSIEPELPPMIEENRVTEVGVNHFWISAFCPAGDDVGEMISYSEIGVSAFWNYEAARAKVEQLEVLYGL